MGRSAVSQQELTPFALFLQEYMWSQRPPLNRATLAQRVNLPKQTISTWFVNRSIPRPSTVIILAKRLGLSARELLTVAGYEPDRYLNDADWLASEEQLPADEVFDFIIHEIQLSDKYKPSERAKIIAHIEELRHRYESDEKDERDSHSPKVKLAR